MTTNIKPVAWPPTADEWARIDRAARVERSRAMAALGRSTVALFKRMIGRGRPTTIWVPSVKGGRITA